MDTHKTAPLTRRGRGMTVRAAADSRTIQSCRGTKTGIAVSSKVVSSANPGGTLLMASASAAGRRSHQTGARASTAVPARRSRQGQRFRACSYLRYHLLA